MPKKLTRYVPLILFVGLLFTVMWSDGLIKMPDTSSFTPQTSPSPSPFGQTPSPSSTPSSSPSTTPTPTSPSQTPPPTADPPPTAFDYKLTQGYNILDSQDSSIYSSSSGLAAFNYLLSLLGTNDAVYINCQISLSSSIILSNLNGAIFVFSSSSLLSMGSSMPNAQGEIPPCAMLFTGCSDVRVYYAVIHGTAALPSGNGHEQAIVFYDCSDCEAIGVSISDVRMFGFSVWDTSSRNSHCGIRDSVVTRCGWNGIQIGVDRNTIGAYAINNEVSHCSDVGIATYGFNCIMQDNHVYDIDGNTGGGGNANYGIAVEDGSGNLIKGNVVSGCDSGIILGTGWATDSNTVTENDVSNCNLCIAVTGISSSVQVNNNMISNNVVSNWASQYTGLGIVLRWGSGNKVVSNTLSDSKADAGTAISVNNNANAEVKNNNVRLTISSEYGVGVSLIATSGSLVQQNDVEARIGILVGSSSSSNTLNGNIVSACTFPIQDLGSGTVIT